MKKKVAFSFLILIGFLGVGFLFSPTYLQNALTYYKADIDDYKIFSNRTIETAKTSPWEVDSNLNAYTMNSDERQELESLDPVAFLVIQDGKIKQEEYWDGYNQNSLSNSFSMAKSIVSLLVGVAIDEGKIQSVEQHVSDFLPSYENASNRSLSIKDLLTMSSGLNWDESYGSPFSITTKAYYGNDINPLIENLKVVEPSGKEFKYLSGNTQVLASVLEQATGMKVGEYASEKLWKPIGAKNAALWSTDKEEGTEKAYCCFNSNARDFARLGQLVLNSGKWQEQQLISSQYITEATKVASFLKSDGKPVDFYGYQFWVLKHQGMSIPYFRGILGQYIFVIPEKNAVVVRLGHNRSEEKINHHPMDTYQYIDLALNILKN